MRVWEELKLVVWLFSRRFEQTLRQLFDEPTKREFRAALDYSKAYFPQVNQGYFGNYTELKRDTERVVGVQVRELSLPRSILGAFWPGNGAEDRILVNSGYHPVFRLSTLGHELCHAVIGRYFQVHHGLHRISVRNRIPDFQRALSDKEELFADALLAIGTYPRPDFERDFSGGGWLHSLWQAIRHLKVHYPDVIHFLSLRDGLLLNVAFIIHYLKLRFFLREELGI